MSVLAWVRRGSVEQASRRTRRLAALGRRILRREWLWCQRNLELVFGPSLEPAGRTRLARRVFEEHFLSYLEGVRWREVEVALEGVEHLDRAASQGAGVVGCCVHLGSWEPGVEAVARHVSHSAVAYRPAENPLSDEVIRSVRRGHRIRRIRRDRVRPMVRCLDRGGLLVIFIDLNVTEGGTAVPFLGVPAMTPPGPARLALRLGCPIVPLVPVRTGEGRATVHLCEMLTPEPSRSAADPVAHLTRRVHEVVEPWILRYAEQYNWLHPRWRTRPSGPPWTLEDPVETLWASRVEPFPALPDRMQSICRGRRE